MSREPNRHALCRLFRNRPSRGIRVAWIAALVGCAFAVGTGSVTGAAKLAPAQTVGDLSVGEQGACILDSDGRQRCLGGSNRQAILSAERFLAVSIAPFDVTCGLKTDGAALCWGLSSPDPDAVAAPGPWRKVVAGSEFGCGIRTDGRLQCWGLSAPAALRDQPTAETYRELAAGYGGVCALRDDSTAGCWATDASSGLATVPALRFLRIGVGDRYACGVTLDGRLACWGSDYLGRTNAPADTGYVSISVGPHHSCALRESGQPICWGDSGYNGVTPPPGTFTDVSVGNGYSCGRRPNGTTECWGVSSIYRDDSPIMGTQNFRTPLVQIAQSSGAICALDELGSVRCALGDAAVQPKAGRYRRLSLGASGGCGIARDDRVRCWGTFPAALPTEPMKAVSLGLNHACAIRMNDTAFCWGDDTVGQTQVPAGSFTEIAAADTYSCGLRQDGSIVCWGQAAGIPTTPTGSGYRSLTANARRVCVLSAQRQTRCWGRDAADIPAVFLDQTSDGIANAETMLCKLYKPNTVDCWRSTGGVSRLIDGFGSLDALAADGTRACAIDATYSVRCNDAGMPGPMRMSGLGEMTLGSHHACNRRADGTIACWGSDTLGQASPPLMQAKAIDANGNHACALGSDHHLTCWGDNAQGSSQAPALAFRDFDVGQFNGCGITAAGTVNCWGWNANGQGNAPAGVFRQVATGLNHSCGVRDTGVLACWGYGADGQTNVPTGAFAAVDVGERHSCAIASNGKLRCWGLNSEGQSSPPQLVDETYRALAVGAFHACAIRQDGGLRCWGRNTSGQSSPPSTGRYVDVSAGLDDSCAIRDDGIRICWGGNASTQIPAMRFVWPLFPGLRYGNAYSATLTAEGVSGYRPSGPAYSIVSGALPGGLSMLADGRISGLSNVYGDFNFVVEARDDNGVSTMQAFRLVNLRRTAGPLPAVPFSSPMPPTRAPTERVGNPQTGARRSGSTPPRPVNGRCRGCRVR